ncbi:hypothetical protein JCM11641_001966 [Rhodosporidiobolus odoratus]
MATSLAAQLAARKQLDSTRLQTEKSLKNPPSFIYTPRHAASVSSADLHSLADNAWEQLASIDSYFAEPQHYKEILGEQAKTLDRTGLTKEENEKVGRAAERTLRALGKHVMLKPAGVVIEWLVRRFRVQDLNTPALLALFLPYHATPHFASALNLISPTVLTNSPTFPQLLPAKQSLSPLPLPELIALFPPFSKATTARPLLDYILRLPLDFLQHELTPHRALTAFWLQTLAGYLDRAGSSLPDGERAAVLSTVLEVLRSARSAPDTLLASYILVSRFALHAHFDAETLRVVLKGVVSNRARSHVADEETDAALVTTLVVLCQLGAEEVSVGEGRRFLGNSGWKSLLKTGRLDELAVQLANQYDASRFMRPFLQTLAEEARSSEDCLSLLSSLLVPHPSPDSPDKPLTLPEPLISHLLYSLFFSISTSEVDSASSPSPLLNPLGKIYQRYPIIWTTQSSIVTSQLRRQDKSEELRRLLQAMNAVLLGGASTSNKADALALSSSAPDVALRVSALKEILESSSALVSAGNSTFLQESLLARLAESEVAVAEVLFAGKGAKALVEHLTAEEVLKAVQPALQQGKADYLSFALSFFAGTFVTDHTAVADAVLRKVFWPRLLATTAGGKSVAASTVAVWTALAGSSLEKAHPWLSGLGKVLPKAADGVSAETNEHIAEALARNVAGLADDKIAEAEAFLLSRIDEGKDVLAHLLALRMAGKVSSTRRVAFATRVLAAVKVELTGLDPLAGEHNEQVLDESNSSVVSKQVQQAVLGKPQDLETLRKLRAALVLGVSKAVAPEQAAAWTWLAPADEGNEYRSLCVAVYSVAHLHSGSPAPAALSTSLLETLFSSLVTDDALAFLSSVFTSSAYALDLRHAALKDASVFVEVLASATAGKGKVVDWQVVLPSFVVALADEEKQIRVEALRALEKVKTTFGEGKKAGTVYGRDKYYGVERTKEVQFLEFADVVAYVGKILASSTELALSPAHLAVLHASLLDGTTSPSKDKKRKAALSFKVATYLVSHVVAWSSSLPARVKLLAALEGVKDKDKSLSLVSLLSSSLSSAPSIVEPELASSYARLLLAPFDGATRKWLESADGAVEALVRAIENKDIAGLKAALRKEALRVTSKSVFGALKADGRVELWKRLVKLAVESEARINTDVLACLRAIPLDSTTLTTFLSELRGSLIGPVAVKGAKRGRTSLASSAASSVSRTERLPELVVVLESVDFGIVLASHALLLGLFDILAALVELPTTATGAQDTSYPGQLLLGALGRVVENVKPESGITGDSVRMAPVLDFMRSSVNPQTYHQSLLLLSRLGPLVPDQLVQNIMPIFTFMGANVLQRDDAYSLRVVDQTLDNIVPALVKALQKSASGRDGLLNELKELLRAFTDAAQHVPRHRRINLFVRLVETLGAKDFMSAVAMLLVDKAGKVDESALPLALTEHFGVEVQFAALTQVVDEVARLVNLEVSFLQSSPDESVLPAKAKEQSLSLLTFLAYALESKQLLSKVDSARTAGSEEVDTSLSSLVRSLLDLSSATSPSFSSADVVALSSAADYAVQAAVALMSTKSFSDALLWLLELADPAIQPRAFALLRTRLPHVKPTRRGDLTTAIVAVVEKVLGVLSSADAAEEDVQSALDTLATIADSTLAAEDAALAKTVPQLVELAKDGEKSRASRIAALGVIRRLTTRLGPRLIPLVARLVPFALDLLQEEAQAGAEAAIDLVTGAYATLEGLFSSVPTFIGGQLDKVFTASLSPAIMSLSSDKSMPASKARAALLSTAAKKLPTKTLYPSIVKLHASLDNKEREPLLGLLDVLNRALRHGKTADVADNYKSIFKLFLTVFDLRRAHLDELDLEDVVAVEENALGAFTQFILKLNEQIFRPLFLRTYDWAVIDLSEADDEADESSVEGLTARKTVLFKLVDRLLGQLKSIFAPYYSFMLDQTVEQLEAYAKGEQTDGDLWAAMTAALTKALDSDETGFWTPTRLAKLSSPIARQIEVTPSIAPPSSYHTLLSSFSELLSSHETHLKSLNNAFLHLTRSDDLRVKRAAVEALEQMWEAVGDAMLAFVPETTPFLAEAREETEGGVEAATRRLIKKIEEHIGEDLDQYMEN